MGGAAIESEDETGGTFAYMAPERFVEGTPPMAESDIWAFGATLYELITGDAPFGNDGGSKQQKGVHIPPIKQNIPEPVKQLIYDCLSYEAKDRPTARSIVDVVLKKRYSRNKKTIALAVIAILIVAVGITFYFTSRNSHPTSNPDMYLNSLIVSGDSLVNVELKAIESNSNTPGPENISGLEKAKVLYTKVNKDATSKFAKRKSVAHKIETINSLIEEIRAYDRANDLAEKAQLTEMEDEYIENSLIAENHKTTINTLIQQLK